MRCFNLTDVKTLGLRARGFVNMPLTVGGVTIKPGQSQETPDTDEARRDAATYVAMGALSISRLPQYYLEAKEAQARKNAMPKVSYRRPRRSPGNDSGPEAA